MYVDDIKVLNKMERKTDSYEKKQFKCKNCGSEYFKEQADYLQCKFCQYICKKSAYKEEEPKEKEYFVIDGGHVICNPYGAKGFSIPQGKFAIARLGLSQNNTVDMIAAMTILFDDKEQAQKLANAMRIKEEEKAIQALETIPLASEEYEPRNIEPVKDLREVFDFDVVDLTEADEIVSPIDRPRLVAFNCGDCGTYKSYNTKFNKNFKCKEPCSRCGKLIKGEIIV